MRTWFDPRKPVIIVWVLGMWKTQADPWVCQRRAVRGPLLKKVTDVWIMIGYSLASICTPKSIYVHINLHEHTQKYALYFFLDICVLAPKNELFVCRKDHIHFNHLFIHCICILTNSQATQCLAEWTECGKKEKEKKKEPNSKVKETALPPQRNEEVNKTQQDKNMCKME